MARKRRRFAGTSAQHKSGTTYHLRQIRTFVKYGNKALREKRCLDAAHDAQLALISSGVAQGNKVWITGRKGYKFRTNAESFFHKFVKACVIKRRK